MSAHPRFVLPRRSTSDTFSEASSRGALSGLDEKGDGAYRHPLSFPCEPGSTYICPPASTTGHVRHRHHVDIARVSRKGARLTDASHRFHSVYSAYYDDVHKYCLRRLPIDAAGDAVCDVFVVAWRRIDAVPQDDRALPGSTVWLPTSSAMHVAPGGGRIGWRFASVRSAQRFRRPTKPSCNRKRTGQHSPRWSNCRIPTARSSCFAPTKTCRSPRSRWRSTAPTMQRANGSSGPYID